MAWTLLLLVFLHSSSGVQFQPTLTQPASVSVSLGRTAKLSCSKRGGEKWDATISWYQQKPGQAPRFVLSGTNIRGEGIPDRFAGSTSGNTGYLTISNVQAEDEADYYCGAAGYKGDGCHGGSV